MTRRVLYPGRVATAAVVLGCLCFAAPTARAQSPEARVGHAADALPGFDRVGLPIASPWPVAVSAGIGYGFTESVLNLEDSHHRIAGRIAASVQPIEHLAIALRLDGRYDTHSGNSMEVDGDDGLVGDPRLVVRGFYELDALSLGIQGTVWVPGVDAPSLELGATSVDLEAMVGFAATEGLSLAANVGYRIDQSADSAQDADRLSPSDRISLGVSEFDAVLLGVGAQLDAGDLQAFGEWTWDVLVGSGAPGISASPMRLSAGARIFALDQDALQFEGRVEVLLLGRPDDALMGPLSPVEPRFSMRLGATYRFPSADVPEEPSDIVPDEGEEEVPTTTIAGFILDEQNQPIPGAEVELRAPDGETFDEEDVDDNGAYRFEDVPVGSGYELVVRADGYVENVVEIDADEGESVPQRVALARDLPNGQIRGVVQSFRGDPVQATVRVEPLGSETTADDEGIFQIDVPPGAYTVVVTAPGYREQSRPIIVEQQGVTILNIDLRRGR